MLLDEPLSNLDAKLREEARVWLRELIAQLGLSALLRHPRPGRGDGARRPRRCCSTAAWWSRRARRGDVRRPRTLFAAEFMGANNRLGPARR